ncbi:hypothetical protein SLEP1_g21074 [Rubroshorea leprosula]|uniref:Uncharacterized protein n=1 Tax=Rubroshorea leprosula TaxID=152421 RepID=A0AAV5JAT2_9ROSI|nr:hypothetical protein SLEP1_g21074 [Rubroshorea leprosula]
MTAVANITISGSHAHPTHIVVGRASCHLIIHSVMMMMMRMPPWLVVVVATGDHDQQQDGCGDLAIWLQLAGPC